MEYFRSGRDRTHTDRYARAAAGGHGPTRATRNGARMKRIGLAALVLLALLCGSAVYQAGAAPATPVHATTPRLGGPHIMPFNPAGPHTAAAPARAPPPYYGRPAPS